MGDSEISESVDVVRAPWIDSPYYESAEQHTGIFWEPTSIFRSLFERLDLRSTLELACGHGRHAEQCITRCGRLTLVDVVKPNILACRERFSRFSNVEYLINDGYRFDGVKNSSMSSVYCYDAMVHFSDDIIASYLKDTQRVLEPGGLGLFHHSNYTTESPPEHYGMNPHARNLMSAARFSELCAKADLEIADQFIIAWGGVESLDCVTLVSKN